MDTKTIQEMVQKLRPVLKDRAKAERLLERYWRDKIAIVWTAKQVHTAANEMEMALTRKEAVQILQHFQQTHNKQEGVRWADITSYIRENVMGRPLNKKEINRFIKKDIITINQ
jgi:hypothetical protein